MDDGKGTWYLFLTGGFNDGFTPTGWIARSATGKLTGYYGVDENSDAYFYREVSGTVLGLAMPGAKGVKTYANAVDNAGECSNLLSKLWRGHKKVPGTFFDPSNCDPALP